MLAGPRGHQANIDNMTHELFRTDSYRTETPATVTAIGPQGILPDTPVLPGGRRLRVQPQVGKDLLDRWPLQDGGDDLELLPCS